MASIELVLTYVLVMSLCGRTPDPFGPATNASATPGYASALATNFPESKHIAPFNPTLNVTTHHT